MPVDAQDMPGHAGRYLDMPGYTKDTCLEMHRRLAIKQRKFSEYDNNGMLRAGQGMLFCVEETSVKQLLVTERMAIIHEDK